MSRRCRVRPGGATGRNDTLRYDPDMAPPHRVAALAYDGLAAFELGVAVEAFAVRRPELDVDWWYDFAVCADCVETRFAGVCPNCGGGFVPRPIRPAVKLETYPASTERVTKAHAPCV